MPKYGTRIQESLVAPLLSYAEVKPEIETFFFIYTDNFRSMPVNNTR